MEIKASISWTLFKKYFHKFWWSLNSKIIHFSYYISQRMAYYFSHLQCNKITTSLFGKPLPRCACVSPLFLPFRKSLPPLRLVANIGPSFLLAFISSWQLLIMACLLHIKRGNSCHKSAKSKPPILLPLRAFMMEWLNLWVNSILFVYLLLHNLFEFFIFDPSQVFSLV